MRPQVWLFSAVTIFYFVLHRLYERALAAAGLEFRSDKLWDSFISWESEENNLKGITAIYERLIRTPTQLYSHHWDKYVLWFCVYVIHTCIFKNVFLVHFITDNQHIHVYSLLPMSDLVTKQGAREDNLLLCELRCQRKVISLI